MLIVGLLLLAVFLCGVAIIEGMRRDFDPLLGASFFLGIAFSVALLVVSVDIGFQRVNTRVTLAKHNAMFETIRDTRKNNTNLIKEVMIYKMLVRSVSNANEWIRAEKAWNKSAFDWWVDDCIEDAEEFRW